ncbi:hypothetical protein A4A49_57042, partial [Nicotiana attenuata]
LICNGLIGSDLHYGGDWIYYPQVLYSRKFVHTVKGFNFDQLSYNYLVNKFTSKLGFIGVQQVIVNGPSGRYYEIESDQSVRSLLSLVSDQFNVIYFFAVDECELSINAHNIVQHTESNIIELDAATDCRSDDSEEHGRHSSDSSDNSDSESDSLERLHTQKERKISDKLIDYKELHKSMTFKDIPEAGKFINMYFLANGYGLKQLKSCPQKLRVNAKTIAAYFKRGLQDNPKIKIKEMMASVKAALNINDLIDSVHLVLPEAHHRYCVRHIEVNWCKRWGHGEYKKYFWWAAWSTYEEYFKDQLRNMTGIGDSSSVRKKAITGNQIEKMAKLKTRKGNGKSQN